MCSADDSHITNCATFSSMLGKHKDRGKWKNGASNNNKAASMKVDSKGSENEIRTIGG